MHCVVCWDAGCQSSCFNTFFTNPTYMYTGFYLKIIIISKFKSTVFKQFSAENPVSSLQNLSSEKK